MTLVLRFDNHEDFIEIELACQEDDNLPTPGDAYLTVRVSSAGFTGHNDLWVHHLVLRSFREGLVNVERDRRGEAEHEAVCPEEMRIRIRVVDRRGHVAVEGITGYLVQRDNSSHWHAVHFGFEFDPSQLTTAATVDWVRRNALSTR